MAGASGSQDGLLEKAFDAVRRGDLETLQETVNSGFDLNEKDPFDNALLHLAAEKGHCKVVQYLTRNGAVVDARDDGKSTPLHLAAEKGRLAVVKHLIRNGALVDATDSDKRTPLHLAAGHGYLKVVEFLMEKGALVDATDEEKSTPLHRAAEEGHLAVVRILIESKASVGERSQWNQTPKGKRKGTLVDAIDIDQRTPLHVAASNGRLDVVEFLIGKGALVNATDYEDCTPLHLASNEKVCKILVEKGKADIEAADLNLWRPLHHAVFLNEEERIRYLLCRGASVTSIDIDGNTPCHVAADYNRLDLLEILLPHMKENLCNGQKHTVYDLIRQHYSDRTDSETFSDLLNKFEVLKADGVELVNLPIPRSLKTDKLLRYRRDLPAHNFSFYEPLMTSDDVANILKELEEKKEECLKSLLEQFAHPRIYWTMSGHRGYDLTERMRTFVNYFLKKAADIDPRFAGTLELTGSCGDGTRLGEPNEFDFVLAIQDLSNKQSLKSNVKWDFKDMVQDFTKPTQIIRKGEVKVWLTNEDIRMRWKSFLNHGDELDARSVHDYFSNLLQETSRQLEPLTESGFSFRKVLNSKGNYTKHTVPLVRHMKNGCTLRLHCLITGLWIDVDVVPGIKFSEWPDHDQRVIPVDKLREVAPPSAEIGHYIVPFEWGRWQLSFVTLEKKILSHTEEPLLNVLKILKTLNAVLKSNEKRFADASYWPSDYIMKTAFLHYLASARHDHHDELSLTETTVAIVKKFCGNVYRRPIYSFFLPKVRLWDPYRLPEHLRKHKFWERDFLPEQISWEGGLKACSVVTRAYEHIIWKLVPASSPVEEL